MNKPTKKQTALLKFINEFTIANNHSPSYREIQAAMGLNSVSTVAQHIENCINAGFLKKTDNPGRFLEIIPIETYDETKRLIKGKIVELNQKLEEENLGEQKKALVKDDVLTLKAAARILGLDL